MNYRKEKQPGLLERLTEYAGSDAYPFHMPGHKRREIPDGIPGGFPDPYGIDITEIDGFDNLHHAEGILKDAMDEAAAIYGADLVSCEWEYMRDFKCSFCDYGKRRKDSDSEKLS